MIATATTNSRRPHYVLPQKVLDCKNGRFTKGFRRREKLIKNAIPDSFDDFKTSRINVENVTIITKDGRLVYIPGNIGKLVKPPPALEYRMPTWEEQKLCIGASFIVAATNGHDPARRVNLEGFCQSVDYLSESIEQTVKQQRGEILREERELKSGVHEILKITVTVPFLWGIPPQLDPLNDAILLGGGVIHRMYHQWVLSQ